MGVMVGANKPKFQYGASKAKKIYKGTTQIYSSGNICTYVVDSGVSYQEEVEEGESCLSPKTFTPSKSGWTFVGWRQDATANASVYSSLVMGDAPITLYAVFKQVITLSTVANRTTSNQSKDRIYNNGNVANPSFTVSNPSKSGASFLGWSASSSSTSISNSSISNLTLTASTTRWAVFKYANSSAYTLNWAAGTNAIYLKQHQGVSVDKKNLGGNIPSCNTNIYGSVVISTPEGTRVYVNKDDGIGYRSVSAWYSVGTNTSTILASVSFSENEDSGSVGSNWNGKTVTININQQGTVPVCLNAQLSGGNGFCSGGAYAGNDGTNGGTVTFIGRTVVG